MNAPMTRFANVDPALQLLLIEMLLKMRAAVKLARYQMMKSKRALPPAQRAGALSGLRVTATKFICLPVSHAIATQKF